MNKFSLQVKKATEKMADDLVSWQNDVIFSLCSAIIMDTPVDTGQLRGNWRFSTSSAQMSVERIDKSGSMATEELNAFLSGFSGGDMYMLNGMSYASDIEYGSSKKAPDGMVRRNVARVKSLIGGK